jgi:hypothetical protein
MVYVTVTLAKLGHILAGVVQAIFFTYNELVTSRINPQQYKQPTNTTTMVMEPLAPPAAGIR